MSTLETLIICCTVAWCVFWWAVTRPDVQCSKCGKKEEYKENEQEDEDDDEED